MDTVYISDLTIETIIGVYEWEKNIKQKVVLNLELHCDISQAAASDNLDFALDYAAISSSITQFIESNRFQLIETIAEQTAELVLTNFAVAKLKLQVAKPGAVKNAKTVGVRIERSKA